MLCRKCLIIFSLFILTAIGIHANTLPEIWLGEKEKELFDKAIELEKGDSLQVQQALEIYDLLIENNHSDAMVRKGRFYSKGDYLPRDYKQAFELFEKASQTGNINGTYELGQCYHRGKGTVPNMKKAFELYKTAADKGHRTACYGTGYLFYKGFGTKQNYSKAIEYLEKGAEKGHPGCDLLLANHYMNGYGGKKDTLKALLHLKRGFETRYKTDPERAQQEYDRIYALKDQPQTGPKTWSDVERKRLPYSKKRFRHQADHKDLPGVWSGKLYTYDWSGSRIIGEENIELILDTERDIIYLEWRNPDTQQTVATYNLEREDNLWRAPLPVSYPKINKREICYTKFGIRQINKQPVLYVDLLMADHKKKEWLQPMMAVLDKKIEISSSVELLGIYPLPVRDKLTVDFSFSSPQEVLFEIYDLTGKKVYERNGGNYPEGTHSESLNISLGKGGYVLRLTGDNFSVSRNIMVNP